MAALSVPAPAVAATAPLARLAVVLTGGWQALAAAMLLLRPELDPSWQPPSEWAIGRLGWIMSGAFLLSSLGYFALCGTLAPQVRGVFGRIGLALLCICALGSAGVGLFTSDPITTPMDAVTARGMIHTGSGSLNLLLLPFAALCLNLHLAHATSAWASVRRALSWSAWLPLLALIAFVAAMIAIESADHHAGPDVPVGWPSRLLLLSYSIWAVVLASLALKVSAADKS